MEQTYGSNDQDYRGQLTAIKSANPDAILVPGYYSDAASIVKQARELGITVPLLGGDGWSSPQLLTIGGSCRQGCYFSDHMSIKDPRAHRAELCQGLSRGKFKTEPTSMSALGYDAAKILFDAITPRQINRQKGHSRRHCADQRLRRRVPAKSPLMKTATPKSPLSSIAVKNSSLRLRRHHSRPGSANAGKAVNTEGSGVGFQGQGRRTVHCTHYV